MKNHSDVVKLLKKIILYVYNDLSVDLLIEYILNIYTIDEVFIMVFTIPKTLKITVYAVIEYVICCE
jgi:hypothetical protein